MAFHRGVNIGDRNPAAVDIVSKFLMQYEDFYDDWPTNEELGGSLTGTRDDEYRGSVMERACDWIDTFPVLNTVSEAEWGNLL